MRAAEEPRDEDSSSTPCGDIPTAIKSPKSLFHNLRTSCTQIGEVLSHDGDRREMLNHEKERKHRSGDNKDCQQLKAPSK